VLDLKIFGYWVSDLGSSQSVACSGLTDMIRLSSRRCYEGGALALSWHEAFVALSKIGWKLLAIEA
jgi:hypothetical protein